MFTKKALTNALIAGVAILGFSSLAVASQPGFYAGGALGWSNQDLNMSGATSSQKDGLGGNAFAGYQFSPYIAAELGYLYFHNAKASYTTTSGNKHPTTTVLSGTSKDQAADAVAKAILPLPNGVDLYAKGGVAYDDYSLTSSLSTSKGGKTVAISGTQSSDPIRPVGGLGVSYNITPNVSADLGWTHIQKTSGYIPNADLVALGLTYHFG